MAVVFYLSAFLFVLGLAAALFLRGRAPFRPAPFWSALCLAVFGAVCAASIFVFSLSGAGLVIEPVGGVAFDSSASSTADLLESSRSSRSRQAGVSPVSTPAPAPAAAVPAPAAAAPGAPVIVPASWSSGGPAGPMSGASAASPAARSRVVVHTARLSLVVDNIDLAVERVSALAGRLGGWVVSSERSSLHAGSVSFRVPAPSLKDALRDLSGLAVSVESMSLGSEDVTDEFVDASSRLASLRTARDAYREMLSRAGGVDEALQVRGRLSEVQGEMDVLQGRLNYLSEVAAFSLVQAELALAPQPMRVELGEDRPFQAGRPVRLSAEFFPPEGSESFSHTWDFGDGGVFTGSQTIPLPGPGGGRVTGEAVHVYDGEARRIVDVRVEAAGPYGLARGQGSIVADVSEVPSILVSVSDGGVVVGEGDEVRLRASFTRPEGLSDYEYRWDFGDGTRAVPGSPPEGETRLVGEHVYRDAGPGGYEGVLSVSAMSRAGRVEGEERFVVRVTESTGVFSGGPALGEAARDSAHFLYLLGRGLLAAAVWFLIFTPLWLFLALLLGGALLVKRRFF